jgi:ribonuclease Z
MGEHYETKSGSIIANDLVTFINEPGRSYAFCADTLFDPGLGEWVSGVNLLYHEATYLSDLEQRAADRFHSTARQAAMVAGYAKANQLIIGHFSSKYDDLSPFESEAKAIFPKTQLALEGTTFRIMHPADSSY